MRYRSLAGIEPWKESTSRFELHSQTTRLVEGASNGGRRAGRTTGLSPSATPCSKGLGTGAAPETPSADYNSGSSVRGGARFQIWAVAASLAVTGAIPVGFFSSAY